MSFVTGFSRFSPRAGFKEIGNKLNRVDLLQNIYLAGLKINIPENVNNNLAYLSKIQQDIACCKYMRKADIFLFYNGSGLISSKKIRKHGGIAIVEAVNSHVHFQEEILKQEYRSLNLKWTAFHKKEKQRRLLEYKQADYILLPSEFVKRTFIDMGFPEEKLLKVPYGFNLLTAPDNTEDYTSNREFVVLYVGNVSIRKGLRYLIQGFNKLKHPRKKLIIVGTRSDESGIQDISISSNVVFTGELKSLDLENAYKSATVFCLPTIEDGFGLVLGEALSYGKPIIATSNSGASEIIKDGQEGFIVPIRDPNVIAEKLQALADDTHLYQNMRNAAMQRAAHLSGWQETGEKLIHTLYYAYKQHKKINEPA